MRSHGVDPASIRRARTDADAERVVASAKGLSVLRHAREALASTEPPE